MNAIARPIAIEAPIPPIAAATEAAPAIERMLEPSSAVIRMSCALMPVAPSPSTNALTAVAILFSTKTPAPLTLTPAPPPESATAPATTIASIVCVEVACSLSWPVAFTLERST